MSDEAVETKARGMGWVPKEEFRGDEAVWRSAEEFVERGEQIMPILKKNNERLALENAQTRAEVERLNGLVNASQEAITELKKFHSAATAKQVEKAKKDLLTEIKQAKKDGDTDTETDLQEALTELRAAEKDVKDLPLLPTPPQPVVDPAFIAWKAENPWFGQDRRKTALTVAAAEELRADARNNGILGKAFFDMAAADAEGVLHPQGGKKGPSKLEEGSGSHSNGAGAPKGKSYTDLPQDARDVCDRQSKTLVGPGRAFKTAKEWQAHYVEQFFLGE